MQAAAYVAARAWTEACRGLIEGTPCTAILRRFAACATRNGRPAGAARPRPLTANAGLHRERAGPQQIRESCPLLGIEQRVDPSRRPGDLGVEPLRTLVAQARRLVRLRAVERIGRQRVREQRHAAAVV